MDERWRVRSKDEIGGISTSAAKIMAETDGTLDLGESPAKETQGDLRVTSFIVVPSQPDQLGMYHRYHLSK